MVLTFCAKLYPSFVVSGSFSVSSFLLLLLLLLVVSSLISPWSALILTLSAMVDALVALKNKICKRGKTPAVSPSSFIYSFIFVLSHQCDAQSGQLRGEAPVEAPGGVDGRAGQGAHHHPDDLSAVVASKPAHDGIGSVKWDCLDLDLDFTGTLSSVLYPLARL